MKKYKCVVCDMEFELELTEDTICEVCGVDHTNFVEVEDCGC